MDIYDIIGDGQRTVVLAKENQAAIYTWNQLLTIQKFVEEPYDRHAWRHDGPSEEDAKGWREVEIVMLTSVPRNLEEVRMMIKELFLSDFK